MQLLCGKGDVHVCPESRACPLEHGAEGAPQEGLGERQECRGVLLHRRKPRMDPADKLRARIAELEAQIGRLGAAVFFFLS